MCFLGFRCPFKVTCCTLHAEVRELEGAAAARDGYV